MSGRDSEDQKRRDARADAWGCAFFVVLGVGLFIGICGLR
jgi:hypothetical protein